jgi:hypothetical protein
MMMYEVELDPTPGELALRALVGAVVKAKHAGIPGAPAGWPGKVRELAESYARCDLARLRVGMLAEGVSEATTTAFLCALQAHWDVLTEDLLEQLADAGIK